MVELNREGFSRIDLSGAREARWSLEMFGYPSHKTFKHMVRTINNFPVIIEDVLDYNTIYRCNVTTLKAKINPSTTQAHPNRIHMYSVWMCLGCWRIYFCFEGGNIASINSVVIENILNDDREIIYGTYHMLEGFMWWVAEHFQWSPGLPSPW